MTKLNDVIQGINQRSNAIRSDNAKNTKQNVISEQDNSAINNRKAMNSSLLDLQTIKQLGKNGFAVKVIYQSISFQFSSAINESPIVRNQNLADIDLSKAEKESEDSLFDFEEVAKNVMAFIGSTILGAKSRDVGDEKLTELFDQARAGVKQGIGDALGVLKDSDSLTQDIETGIEKSRDLINVKIDELHQQVFAPEEELITNTLTNESSISKSQTSNISVVTAQGDRITIAFSAFEGRSVNEQYNSQSPGESYQSQRISYNERSFSYSLEGDLNDDEKVALGSLIEEVSRIQHSFFNGDIEKAFEKAAELKIEPSQIASFSVNLTQQTSASQKYTEIANRQNEEKEDKRKVIGQQLMPAIDFVKQFELLQQQAEQLLSPSENNIKKFYDSIIKADFLAQPTIKLEDQLVRWNNILEQL